jgi:hypothetical protein
LGIDASDLQEQARVRFLESDAPAVPPVSGRVARVGVDGGRVALPRGVLTAARKAGFANRRVGLA